MSQSPPRLTRHHYFRALGLFMAGIAIEFLLLGGIGWVLEHVYLLGPTPIDAPLLQWFEVRERKPFNNVMLQITALGSVTVLTLLTALAFVAMVLAGRRRVALSILVASLGASVILTSVKRIVDRPRPFAAEVVARGLDQFVGDTHSYPSGHAMGSMAIYLMLGCLFAPLTPNRRCARFTIGAAVGMSLLIGMSRIYLGVHYPTDVLCGWIGGAFWAFITLRAFRLLDPQAEWLAQGSDKPGA